eukprot:365041-Chlamydomonas_euryale.AAC.4
MLSATVRPNKQGWQSKGGTLNAPPGQGRHCPMRLAEQQRHTPCDWQSSEGKPRVTGTNPLVDSVCASATTTAFSTGPNCLNASSRPWHAQQTQRQAEKQQPQGRTWHLDNGRWAAFVPTG